MIDRLRHHISDSQARQWLGFVEQ